MILSHEVWRFCESYVAFVWGNMDKTLLTIITAIISVASFIITFINHFDKPDLYNRVKRELMEKHGKSFRTNITAFFLVYTGKFISAVVAIISAIAFVLILFFMPSGNRLDAAVLTASPTPTITPSAKPSPAPTKINQARLDELTPLDMEPDAAFCFQQWAYLLPIKVNDVEYEHSIGIRIPTAVSEDYKKHHDSNREVYKAYVEYSLAYQYEKLSFNYGIDDSSFREDALCPPQCHFWIVVQSCSSEEELADDENIIFQTDSLNYRRSLHNSGDIDVSGAETIRITVYWEFDVIQSKPLAFNVAIINPILYAKKN